MRHAMMTLVAAIALLWMPPAHAQAQDEIPDDVVAVFSSDLAAQLRDMSKNDVVKDKNGTILDVPPDPDFRGAASFGTIHRIYYWSEDFLNNEDPANPIKPSDEWIAPVLSESGVVLGTATALRASPAELAHHAGSDSYVPLGNALEGLPEGAYLVNDYTFGGWYSVKDGMVTALNRWAATEVPAPMSVEQYQPVVVQRWDDRIADAKRPYIKFGICLVGGVAFMVVGWWILRAIYRGEKEPALTH